MGAKLTDDAATKVAAERLHAERASFIKSANAYGTATIRSLFLLNGGAAIALLTLVGSILGKDSDTSAGIAAAFLHGFQPALRSFGWGLVTAVLAAALGYLNFSALAAGGYPGVLYDMQAKKEWQDTPALRRWFIEATRVLAILACLASALSFIRGGIITSHAMQHVTVRTHNTALGL